MTYFRAVEIKHCKVTSFQKGRRFGSTSKFVNMLQNIIRVWWSPFFWDINMLIFFYSRQKGGETHWNPWNFVLSLIRQDHLCEHHGGGPEVLRPCVDGVAFLCRGVLHGSREGRLGEDWMIPGRLTAIHDGSYDGKHPGRLTAGSPTNHPMKGKEHDLNQTSMIMFQPLIFRGVWYI